MIGMTSWHPQGKKGDPLYAEKDMDFLVNLSYVIARHPIRSSLIVINKGTFPVGILRGTILRYFFWKSNLQWLTERTNGARKCGWPAKRSPQGEEENKKKKVPELQNKMHMSNSVCTSFCYLVKKKSQSDFMKTTKRSIPSMISISVCLAFISAMSSDNCSVGDEIEAAKLYGKRVDAMVGAIVVNSWIDRNQASLILAWT